MFAGSHLLLPVSTNFVTLVPETREEGGTRCQRALAAEGDRGAEEIGQQEVAETASGCPKRWCWSKRRTGGTEDSLPCSWVEEGWLPSERERRSRPRSPGGRSLLPFAMFGEEQGTGDFAAGCPRPEEPPPSARRRRSIGPSTKVCPVPSHGTASEPLSWLRTERQCVREPDRDFIFIFPLSPLSSLSLLILPSPFSRLVCPYPQERRGRPYGLPPGEGGGGSRAQSRGYPPACEERWGYVASGAGPRAMERSEAGGVIGNERHLHHSPVSSPTEELRKG